MTTSGRSPYVRFYRQGCRFFVAKKRFWTYLVTFDNTEPKVVTEYGVSEMDAFNEVWRRFPEAVAVSEAPSSHRQTQQVQISPYETQ